MITTAPAAPVTSKQASVDAALLVLKSMGLSPEDLLGPSNRPPVPTFAEYVPVVSATVTAASLRAYRPPMIITTIEIRRRIKTSGSRD